MIKIVKEVIDRVYIRKDYKYFKAKCHMSINVPQEFYSCLAEKSVSFQEVFEENSPAKRWYVEFKDVKVGDFEAHYSSELRLSKILPVYYIEHSFEVKNLDPEKMTPILDGFDGQPYTKGQYAFEEGISKILAKVGYTRLYYNDMTEVILELSHKDNDSIFGRQFTVETALFRDIFELSL